MGAQPDEVISDHLQRARGFVFAAHEDFGLAPVEAQAAGCPVIAYGRGGALETVTGWPAPNATGVFFDAQTPEALKDAVDLFEANEDGFSPEACRLNAERSGHERFRRELWAVVESLWNRFQLGQDLEQEEGPGEERWEGSELRTDGLDPNFRQPPLRPDLRRRSST